MATATTALQLLAIQRRRFGRVHRSMELNHLRMAVLGKEDLEELTEGSVKSATLRRMGHPFARNADYRAMNLHGGARRPLTAKGRAVLGRKGSLPLRPLNIQTGRLHRSVFMRSTSKTEHEVGASTPYAKYILNPLGTRKMVGRGVMTGHALGRQAPWGEIEKRHRARRRIIREAFLASNRSQ